MFKFCFNSFYKWLIWSVGDKPLKTLKKKIKKKVVESPQAEVPTVYPTHIHIIFAQVILCTYINGTTRALEYIDVYIRERDH